MTAITNQSIYNAALSIIKNLYGDHAAFRDRQYEAIEATLINAEPKTEEPDSVQLSLFD